MMQNTEKGIDTNLLLQDDNVAEVSHFVIDEDLIEIQREIDAIAIDVIPFDRVDAVFVFCNALIGILLDSFLSDPSNPHSLANALNNSKSGIGKWCNNIHESINHKNNPMDFQGGFTKNGNVVTHGSGGHSDISFGGGNHRIRTYDHDILRFWHAIKDYHDGVFRDGGFVDGQFVEVISNVNNYGVAYEAMGGKDAVVKYCCHMFADFFSSKGLPCPGASFLSHADDRQLRKLASDTYKDGMNMRTQMLQTATFVVMDMLTKAFVRLRYVDEDAKYSEEAITSKIHLLQLYTNGLVTAFNVGKVIITEQPQRLNLPIIIHTIRLVGSCMKDKLEYNQRVITKVSLEAVKAQIIGFNTFLIVGDNICYQTRSQAMMIDILADVNKKLEIREQMTDRLLHVLQNGDDGCLALDEDIYDKMKQATDDLPVKLGSHDSLSDMVNEYLVEYNEDEAPSDFMRIYSDVYSKI